jgi:hypothetical protein
MNPDGLSSAPAAQLAPRRVPEAYVRAEIETFPLASVQAFRDTLVALDPMLEGKVHPERPRDAAAPTRKLWRACEESLVPHAGGWTLDRLVAVRDHTWFGHADDDLGRHQWVPLHRYLRHMAHAHLRRQTAVTEVTGEGESSELDALSHYHWLSFSIPEDLLLVAVDVEPPPTRVAMEKTLLIRRLLDRGVADIHQHVSAGLDFPLLWAGAMAALAAPKLAATAMVGPGMPMEGDELLRWMLVAAIARMVLTEFLLERERSARHPKLHDLLRALCRPRGARFEDAWTLKRAFEALVLHPSEPPEFEPLHHLYTELHPYGARLSTAPPGSLKDVWRWCDPVAARLDLATPSAGERWLVRHGLAYLERGERRDDEDPWFAGAFWQVLRLRCLYYRHIVQRPLTAGLQWFVRYQNHIGQLSGPLERVQAEAAFRVAMRSAAPSDKIQALEIRLATGESTAAVAARLRTVTASWQNVLAGFGGTDCPELGVIVHFIKERDPDRLWPGGTPRAFGASTHAQPSGRNYVPHGPHRSVIQNDEVRFGNFLAQRRRNASALAELLCAVPSALWLLRGIDVANDELATPTWVLVPLYAYMRQEAAYASTLPGAGGVPPLRTTAHVGEDFRHLLEGLRRIFEAVRYLLAGNGGRLGHATALGFEPRTWAESVGSVLMPREERLWDLVFEWRLYAGFEVPAEFIAQAPPGRQAYLALHIHELLADICDYDEKTRRSWDLSEIAQLHHDLHRFMTDMPHGALHPEDISVTRELHRALDDPRWIRSGRAGHLERYLCDAALYRRGQELVEVTLDEAEISALSAVQDALRRGIAARGIAVEVNPTSNLLIGDLLDLRNHPILRLFPIEPDKGPPPVQIAIGSDDPVTFNTSLLREYALLYQAARAAGYSDRTVQDWLDRVRQTSMDARFTLAWCPDARVRAQQLIDDLDWYLQKPNACPRRRASQDGRTSS